MSETEQEHWSRLDEERETVEATQVRAIQSWVRDPDMVAELGYRVIAAMVGERPAPVAWGELAPELTARDWFARDWLDG